MIHSVVPLEGIDDVARQMLQSGVRGRVIVRVSS